MHPPHRTDGFVAFFRRYAQTWVHALATAALTLFGTLTFVHRLFAALAVAAYVLPPVVLYLTRSDDPASVATGSSPSARSREASASGAPAAPDAPPTDGRAAVDEDRTRTREPDSSTDDDSRSRTRSGARSGSNSASRASSSSRSSSATEPSWVTAPTPVDDDLHDVVVVQSGAYAVGAGGVVLADADDGWRVAVSDGPGAASNTLRGVDAVPGGVWFAGDGGAVSRLDPATGRHVDHSAPAGDTTNVTGLAVAGDDDETVLLVDGSGRVRRGRWRDGTTTWADPVTPGGGSSLAGVALVDESVGYLCDTNDGVFRTTDGGQRFTRVGPVGASGTLTDVAATTTGPLVAADDGVLHRSDGGQWTPTRLDDDALHAVAVGGPDGDGDSHAVDGLACGTDGLVYERSAGTADWEGATTSATTSFSGVALGRRGSGALAVGPDGTVVERVEDTG